MCQEDDTVDPVQKSNDSVEDSRRTSDRMLRSSIESKCSLVDASEASGFALSDINDPPDDARNRDSTASTSASPWYELRKDATEFVSQKLQRGRKNLWQLITSRLSVLLSSAASCSTSIHQFLRNYEDINAFILAGEAFCGFEAVEFRKKLKAFCDNYFSAFHRQNVSVSQNSNL